MEIILCMLLAALFTGGRVVSDAIHAAKGTTPAHLEKARLKAEQKKPQRSRSTYADGKPRLKDVAAVYWGDAMSSAIDAHNRRRAEKAAQRRENERAAAAGEQPERVRPSLKARAIRWWRLLIDPVGEKPPASTPQPADDDWLTPDPDEPHTGGGVVHEGHSFTAQLSRSPDGARWSWACRNCPGRGFDYPTEGAATEAAKTHDCRPRPVDRDTLGAEPLPKPQNQPASTEGDNVTTTPGTGTPTAAPTGEAVNYETTLAELDKIEEVQRAHVDSTQVALGKVQDAKAAISNSQGTYRPAADAAGSTHQHLTALNLDSETVANTGTMVDSMPPNRVDEMFEQLESMEADAQQQLANAEAALASTIAARQTIVAKYGDAHTTVQGELAGDSRFLASSGATAP